MQKPKYQSQSISQYLISERPLVILPGLAKLIGVNEAIFIQQLHFLLTNKEETARPRDYREGRIWIENTQNEWLEKYFYFWSRSTFCRILAKLQDKEIIIKKSLNEDKYDHTMWYAIDYDKLNGYLKEKHDKDMDEAVEKAEEN